MPEGSVELDTKVLCWTAKVHLIVIIAMHVFSGLGIAGAAIGEFMILRSKWQNVISGVTQGDKQAAQAGMAFYDLYGGVLVFFLCMPALWCLLEGAFTSCLCCCKSKCCYGFYAITTSISVCLTAYGAISSLIDEAPFYMLTVKANDGGYFSLSFMLIGVFGILSIFILAYCAFVLCKLSYFDRAGGGHDADEDLYAIDEDVEKSSKSDTVTEKTLSNMTGIY